MEIFIAVVAVVVIGFFVLQFVGQTDLDKPVEGWSDEELVRRLPKYGHVLSAAVKASDYRKVEETKKKMDEIRAEMLKREVAFRACDSAPPDRLKP